MSKEFRNKKYRSIEKLQKIKNLKKQNILIFGGSGNIGSYLKNFLDKDTYKVTIISRNPSQAGFHWNPANGYMNPDILQQADVVINLSGENISKKRWSSHTKSSIVSSRVQSTRLIANSLQEIGHKPSLFINASAIGFYGDRGDTLLTEKDSPGDGFLPYVAWHWENEAAQISLLGIRTVILRIGIVLSKDSGALPLMLQPFRFYTGATFGAGEQYYSWIHIDDLCSMIEYIICNKQWHGIYNAVSQEPVTNQVFTKQLSTLLKKPVVFPKIPQSILRFAMGERISLLLDSTRVSNQKTVSEGFIFRFPYLVDALRNILG